MNNHDVYMKRCIHLAKKGLGKTYPNPLVGAVIICDKKVIGEGFHYESGKEHAEVIAIKSVKNKKLLKTSTLYVNLEPCSHFGKTPPCTNIIIEKKIPKVIIGVKDPHSIVNGSGIDHLRKSNIDVLVGVCIKDCLELNKRFFTFYKKKRPYIFLKFAKSLNGFMSSTEHKYNTPFYISNKYSLQKVHYRRTQEQSIIIGKNTVIKDNPNLDTRLVGNSSYPQIIILDKNLESLNYKLKLFNSKNYIWIYNIKENKKLKNIECIKVNKNNFLKNLLKDLYKRDIHSIIVEGGRLILDSFIYENFWDEAEVYIGNILIQDGILSPIIRGDLIDYYLISKDIFFRIKNNIK